MAREKKILNIGELCVTARDDGFTGLRVGQGMEVWLSPERVRELRCALIEAVDTTFPASVAFRTLAKGTYFTDACNPNSSTFMVVRHPDEPSCRAVDQRGNLWMMHAGTPCIVVQDAVWAAGKG